MEKDRAAVERRPQGRAGRRWAPLVVTALAVVVAAGAIVRLGRGDPAAKSAETRAVEARVGDFADYWGHVLKLSRRYTAHPDSFRAAVDSLPGSHLTDAEWNAWVAPYHKDPLRLADKLERAMAEMTATPISGARPVVLPAESPPPSAGARPLTGGPQGSAGEAGPIRAIPAPPGLKTETKPGATETKPGAPVKPETSTKPTRPDVRPAPSKR